MDSLKLKVLLLFITLSYSAFAQRTELVKSIANAKTSDISEYYSAVPGKGILYIRELKGKMYGITLFDQELNQIWDKVSSISNIKKMEVLTAVSRDNEFSMYFYKKRYIGFFPKSKLKEIKFNYSDGNTSQYKYRIKNYTLPIGIYQFNNKTYLAGVECYKPWHVWRVVRFASPFAAAILPEMPVATAILAGVGTFSVFTWILPTSPRTRPALVELNKGKANYINRKLYKTHYYKNKGIQAIAYQDGNFYLGITNAVKHGKNPIIVDRYDDSFKRISTVRFPSKKKKRISAFRFDSLSGPEVSFKGSYGNKVVSSIGSIRYDPRKSNTQAFDGKVASVQDGKDLSIKVENNPNKLRDQDVNEVFRRRTEVIVNSTKVRRMINGQDIEFTLFEDFIPDIHTYTYTTYSNGSYHTHTSSTLVGYFVRNLRLNIHNYTTNTFDIISTPNQDFDHYESPGRVSNSLMHACFQFNGDKIFLNYVNQYNQLVYARIYPDNFTIANEGSIDILKEGKGDNVNYSMLALSDNKFFLAIDMYNKRDEEGKKNDRSERYKSMFNIYETK